MDSEHFPESRFSVDLRAIFACNNTAANGLLSDDLARAATIKSVPYSRLKWNIGAQHYYLPKGATSEATGTLKPGAFIPAKAVRGIIEVDITHQEQQLKEILKPLHEAAVRYIDGDVTEDDWKHAVVTWHEATAKQVKYLHLNHLAAARGGYHAMTYAAYGRVGAVLAYHYKKLNTFASDVFADPGIVLGTSSKRMSADRRVALYAKCGLMTYEAERKVAHYEQGFLFEENEEHSHESCNGPNGCRAQTKKGRVPIFTLLDIGKRSCTVACLCTFNYFKSL